MPGIQLGSPEAANVLAALAAIFGLISLGWIIKESLRQKARGEDERRGALIGALREELAQSGEFSYDANLKWIYGPSSHTVAKLWPSDVRARINGRLQEMGEKWRV